MLVYFTLVLLSLIITHVVPLAKGCFILFMFYLFCKFFFLLYVSLILHTSGELYQVYHNHSYLHKYTHIHPYWYL